MFTIFKRLTWKTSLLTSLICLLVFTIALAASGDLDTTFSGDGRVTSYAVPSNPNRYDIAIDIAFQSNGKIVAAGYSFVPSTNDQDFALIRYNTGGSLDTTFHQDGRLTTNLGGVDYAYDVAVQSNGKIIASGRSCATGVTACDVAIVRYNSGGGLDTTFSGDGKVLTDFGGDTNGSTGGLVIQSDGKIVVSGYMWNGTDYDFAVYRYNANGSLDTTFSGDGMVNIGFGAGRQDQATDLAVQNSDGKIVVGGFTGDASGNNNDFALMRLNSNGSLDTTFSGDGRQTTHFGGDEYAYGLSGHPNGRIVLVGRKIGASGNYFAISRYNTNGSLDTTFNGTGMGRKVFSIGPGAGTWQSWAGDVTVQPDNKIVVLGLTSDFASINDIALVRLNPGGGFDTTFSGDGKVFIDFGGDDYGYSVVRQPSDGKYVLVGNTNNGIGGIDFALARLLP